MITIITGPPGVGKTSLMTSFAVTEMTNYEDIFNKQDFIRSLNEIGYNKSIPEHFVFTNYDVICPHTGQHSYFVNGYYLGFKNNRKHPTMFLPSGANIYISEAQEVFNSRESSRFPDFLSRYMEKHRHFELNFYLDCQRGELIDLNVRAIAEKIIDVREKKDKYNAHFGFLEKTVWTCEEYKSWSEYENGESGKKKKYEYDGDIHDCYDSQGCFLMFMNGNEERNFNLRRNISFGIDKESSAEYNKLHRYEVPKTFYKKRS